MIDSEYDHAPNTNIESQPTLMSSVVVFLEPDRIRQRTQEGYWRDTKRRASQMKEVPFSRS